MKSLEGFQAERNVMTKIIENETIKQDLDYVIYKDGIHNGDLNKYDTDYSDEAIEKVWSYIIRVAYRAYCKGIDRANTELNK